jgi:Uma2 family endonuclease
VKELWLVDETGERVELRTLAGERYLEGQVFARGDRLRSLVIPDLSIEVTKVFED